MFLCLTCVSDEACINYLFLKENENFDVPCPKEGCPGVLLHLDDGIAEALVALNGKGYVTKDSCGGHFNNAEDHLSFYVAFEDGKRPPIDTLPDAFMLWPDENCIFTADLEFKAGSRTIQIMDLNRKFLEWVMTLPARTP